VSGKLRSGNYDAEMLERCIKLFNKGIELYNIGRFKEAIKYCEKGMKINPKHAAVWNNLGVALHNLGREKEARECFKVTDEETRIVRIYGSVKVLSLVSLVDLRKR